MDLVHMVAIKRKSRTSEQMKHYVLNSGMALRSVITPNGIMFLPKTSFCGGNSTRIYQCSQYYQHEYSLKVQSYFACIAHGSRSICSSKALSMTHSLNLQLNAQDAYWIIKTRKTQQFLQPSISPYCQTPSNVTDHHNSLDTTISCGTCLMGGHTSDTCFPFAKCLLYREAEKKVDAQNKLKLIGAYKSELRRKRDLRLKRHQLGTIRQMWQEGGTYEELKSSLLATMPEYQEAAEFVSDNEASYYSDE
mmetsp:Transcript_28357/g.40629  ORF Transcript_28357/g.40629 Transcript_28357/m.40629 type:complete len:249 (+) Transcript_28357:2499-3245(+)